MIQTIRAALAAIVSIQEALTITDPLAVTVKKAWKYFPPEDMGAVETPFWMNAFTAHPTDVRFGYAERNFTVHMMMLVKDADEERAADIATAFYESLEDAHIANRSLSQTVVDSQLRGAEPTITTAMWAGVRHIALEAFLDLVMKEGVEVS